MGTAHLLGERMRRPAIRGQSLRVPDITPMLRNETSSETMPFNNNPPESWPSSIQPKIGSKAGGFHQCFEQSKSHADRPVGTCNRRSPLTNSCKKLTRSTQSDMFAQCTCNAMKNCFKRNRRTHAAKLSIHSLFFLTSFSLLSFENQAA